MLLRFRAPGDARPLSSRHSRWRSLGALGLALGIALGLVGGPGPRPVSASSFSFNFGDSPPAPKPWLPGAVDDWDLIKNYDFPSNAAGPQNADHGSDCSAPPATHAISSLDDAAFICKYHMMTALAATDQAPANYGAIYFSPAQLVDFSASQAAVTFDVDTNRTSARDWWDVWITPFSENLVLPLEGDLPAYQGPPPDAVHIRMDNGSGSSPNGFCSFFRGEVFSGYAATDISQDFGGNPPCMENLTTPSASVRSPFELDIAQNHVRFSMPGTTAVWVDAQVNLPFTQGVVQFAHHSYNPTKDGAGAPDTWHWSNFSISPAAPFTILRGDTPYLNAGTTAVEHLAAVTPAGSFLRFAAIGSISVSFDGGRTFQPAQLQQQSGVPYHIEHFGSYWTPMPAGVSQVVFKGAPNAYGQPWWVEDVAAWSASASTPVPAPPPAPQVFPGGGYTPVVPYRVLDTRPGPTQLGPAGSLGPDSSVDVPVAGTGGAGGVPAGATGVVLNVTAVGPASAGYLTVFPTGVPRPVASSLNFGAGQVVASLVEVALGTSGAVSIFNHSSAANVVVDVSGYTAPAGDGFYPLSPVRVLDTRPGAGHAGPLQTLQAGQTADLPVAGLAGVPAGAVAVVLNVTAASPSAPGFLTVWPTGGPRPTASNLNFGAGQTVANRVQVELGGGALSLFNLAGSTDVVVDVDGYFLSSGGAQFTGVTPTRLEDTRTDGRTLPPGGTLPLTVVGGPASVPSGAVAVVLTLTVAGSTSSGYLTASPGAGGHPLASDLDFSPGQPVANLVVVGVSGGAINVFNSSGSTDVIVDLLGWYS